MLLFWYTGELIKTWYLEGSIFYGQKKFLHFLFSIMKYE